MSIVTITSDWNKGDYYANLRVVEIANSVPSFDILQEVLILKSTFLRFPESTIHLLGVMSEPTPNSYMVILYSHGHYFIGVNDGRFSLLFETLPAINFESCTKASAPKKEHKAQIVHNLDTIVGRVVYCGSFRNAITDIENSLFDSIHNGRDFAIFVQGLYLNVTTLENLNSSSEVRVRFSPASFGER